MILVTGATGLIGSHLIYKLLQQNDKIIAIKRQNTQIEKIKTIFSYYTKNYEELFSQIIWRDADILSYEQLNDAFEGVKKVYHCAAIVSFDAKMKKLILKNNVVGTANLVNIALERKIDKLCHVSSIASLGDKTDNMITEITERDLNIKHSTYSVSKYDSELEVWRAIEEGLNAVIINPSIVLGPAADNWKNGSPSIFYSIWKGIKFYTEGVTGYVDVNDVVNIMIQLMESNITAERFILNAENLSYKQVFSKIADALNIQPPKYKATKPLLALAWRMDKIKSLLPYQQHNFTRETALSATNISKYDNSKIIKTLNYSFKNIDQTISEVANILKTNLVHK